MNHNLSVPLNCYLILLGLMLMPVQAITFEASLGQSRWFAQSSALECRLYQPIPNYGLAAFERQAGQPMSFILESGMVNLGRGQARLTMEAPAWQPSAITAELGTVSLQSQPQALVLTDHRVQQLLEGVSQGMAPTVSTGTGYRVKLSPARFRDHQGEFMVCMANLLPGNFAQFERSSVFFNTDVRVLDDEAKSLLDDIALYVDHDDRISQIYIEGHADERGSAFYNRRLSEDRAMAVTQYMISRGVSPSLIVTRFHGDAFPARQGGGEQSWAANRRVTVRLERF